jgi:hypothetical protein
MQGQKADGMVWCGGEEKGGSGVSVQGGMQAAHTLKYPPLLALFSGPIFWWLWLY